jgi:hypothetical protein
MQCNKPQRLKHLTKSERQSILSEFQRINRKGLLSTVARELGVDRATAKRAFDGTTSKPDPKILDVLWREIQSLVCAETETGKCSECPLRKACERLAKGAK